MRFSRKLAPLLGLAALGLMTTAPALAQTPITGPHDNVTTGAGIGDLVNRGSYSVANGTTFDNNAGSGLVAFNRTTGTITGGEFDNNGGAGLNLNNSSTATITGGSFTGNGVGLVAINGSTVTITGGLFTGNNYDIQLNSSSITLFGNFTNYVIGGTTTLITPGSSVILPSSINGSAGSFTGTLENGGGVQTINYLSFGGALTLDNVPTAVPEPSSVASFAIGGLGLMGLMLKARKRRVA